jgi:hypothetical protein
MLRAVVVALLLAPAVALAEDEPPKAPVDRFIEAAKTIEAHRAPEAVEAKTSHLGSPSLEYAWCNRAGCVDHAAEARATRMTATWYDEDETYSYVLMVWFCGGAGRWESGWIKVGRMRIKPGAWGTQPKPETLYESGDQGWFYSQCRNG